MRVYVTFVICSICILAGACGNSLPLASSLSVAITPPTATVTAGTGVNLTGSGSWKGRVYYYSGRCDSE
jgi:hypothetical protein